MIAPLQPGSLPKPPQVFVTRFVLRNYKSIEACELSLGALTFLVGPNGSGKSNCLDGLRFVSEALRTSLDHALRDRGTIKEVRRRSGGHPNDFTIGLDFQLPSAATGHYLFRVGARDAGGFEVLSEECQIQPSDGSPRAFFQVRRGKVSRSSIEILPAALADRLFLVAASGVPEFRPAYDALSQIEVYNLNPKEIGAMQRPDPGNLLRRDGGNAASVFQKLAPSARQRIQSYLQRIVPGIHAAEPRLLGSLETVEFRQGIKKQKHASRFLAASMSDGTLRSFAILLALFQELENGARGPLLIGLEEPEMALHPAATGILLGALREASHRTQVLVTSHSPELLDDSEIPAESIVAVSNEAGLTRLAPVDEAGRSLLRDRLFTVGELLRQNQLVPEPRSDDEPSNPPELPLWRNGTE